MYLYSTKTKHTNLRYWLYNWAHPKESIAQRTYRFCSKNIHCLGKYYICIHFYIEVCANRMIYLSPGSRERKRSRAHPIWHIRVHGEWLKPAVLPRSGRVHPEATQHCRVAHWIKSREPSVHVSLPIPSTWDTNTGVICLVAICVFTA